MTLTSIVTLPVNDQFATSSVTGASVLYGVVSSHDASEDEDAAEPSAAMLILEFDKFLKEYSTGASPRQTSGFANALLKAALPFSGAEFSERAPTEAPESVAVAADAESVNAAESASAIAVTIASPKVLVVMNCASLFVLIVAPFSVRVSWT